MAYAAVEDLEARRSPSLPPMTDADEAYAGVLLGDAAAYLNQILGIAEGEVEPGSTQAENLKIVSCNMVSRLMETQQTDNMDSISQSIGSMSASVHFAVPEASMYLTKSDRALLGVSRGRYQSVRPEGAW